jgi:hypothetical protein
MEAFLLQQGRKAIMPKLHIARSEFYDPILNLPDGVHLLAPYAIRPLVGCLEDRITANSIPRLWDGERWLTLVDHREGPHGFGGKYFTKNRRGEDPFPAWKGYFICPLKK